MNKLFETLNDLKPNLIKSNNTKKALYKSTKDELPQHDLSYKNHTKE